MTLHAGMNTPMQIEALRERIAELEAAVCPQVRGETTRYCAAAEEAARQAKDARRQALEEALIIAWREAGHGLEPEEVEEGSYYDGWEAGIDAYKAAIRALKDEPR